MKHHQPHIIFEVTTVCNLDCRYCYNIWKRPGETVDHVNSFKEAKKTLKKLFSIAHVDHVTFTGGEPFLTERFNELVLFARMKKKSVTIISNGTAAKKEDYKTMIDLGVGLFEFPLHSYKSEIHDYLANQKGAFQKSNQSIQDILSLNGNIVTVIVIGKPNFQGIKKTLKYLTDLGINRIMLNRFNIGGRGIVEKHNLLMTNEELNHAFSEANKFAESHSVYLSSNVCTPYCLVDPEKYPNIAFTHCGNSIKNMPLTLQVNGDLRICNHSPNIIGNIYRDKLNTLESSNYGIEWNKVPGYCLNCHWKDECRGGCRAASEQLGLGTNKEDPLLIETTNT